MYWIKPLHCCIQLLLSFVYDTKWIFTIIWHPDLLTISSLAFRDCLFKIWMWSVETIILLSTEKGRIILNFSCGAFFTKTTFSTNLPPFQWEVSSSLIHPFVRLLENPACWSGLKSGPRFAAVNEINNLAFWTIQDQHTMFPLLYAESS